MAVSFINEIAIYKMIKWRKNKCKYNTKICKINNIIFVQLSTYLTNKK